MKNWLRIIFVILLVLVADLVTKHFLFEVEYFNLIPNIISIQGYVENTGVAGGLLADSGIMVILLSVAMIVALLVFNYFVKKKTALYCISFGFILGGALGNLYDRIALSHVRDFIFFDFWPSFPTFNVADSFLCIGAVMLAIYILFSGIEKKGN